MPAYIKLTDAGSSHTFLVERVTLDTAGNYPDYQMHTDDGNTVVVFPKAACDRQLERLKIATAEALAGAYVTVSRSDQPGKNGKLFWNLDIAAKPKAQQSKRLPPPEQQGQSAPPHHDDVPPPEDPEEAPAPRPTQTSTAPSDAMREKVAKREAVAKAYLALWDRVAAHLNSTCDGHDIVVSADAIQAATATIWIGWRDAGVR